MILQAAIKNGGHDPKPFNRKAAKFTGVTLLRTRN